MSIFKTYKKEMIWGGKKLSLETGKIARQADGAVIAKYGDTEVIATVCASKNPPETFEDFIPLTVNYQEKTYAAGRIPGGFFKREGKPSEAEVLTSRLIDRPIRPLFAKGFNNETQVVCTLISHDLETQPDIVAMIAASAALTISGLPFLGPIAGARIGYIDGQYVLNPDMKAIKHSQLDLVVAGTQEGVLMVESEAQELSEDVMLGAVSFGHESIKPVIEMIISLAEECAKDPWEVKQEPAEYETVRSEIMDKLGDEIKAAYQIHEKLKRQDTIAAVREKAHALFADREAEDAVCDKVFHELEARIMRDAVLNTGIRIDGRDTKTIRVIETEVGFLPKSHGSALFTRGETQAMVTATLGTGEDEQIVDSLAGEYKERFLLHYNFPPFSVGEVGRLGSPGRREIGHGKLAWRAIHPMLPKFEDFPYTIRVVSDIMESNGSSSMATVCGSTLSLMDAGVPMKKPVAGIAMGLIKEKDKFVVLSDILGDEDHLGDMDFKVAGTRDGVTALQMDIKITSITTEIMKTALAQAHEGRQFILNKMAETIAEPRAELNKNAPRIQAFKIDPEKIRDVIGTGGKVIREIVEKTGAKVDIEDDGTIRIAAVDQDAGKAAYDWIQGIIAEPEEGKNYLGTVCKIMEFGAFVTFVGKTDGLVHISEMAPYRVEKVTDLVKEGDKVWVKCMGADNRGKIRLSMKRVNQETGEDAVLPEEPKKERKEKHHHEKKAEDGAVMNQTGEDLAGIFGDK
ncbi:MAG: polyribonucleotide nucleotidyltransferase [Alphaproteobacteria bacterium]|nr:polyribonucleotide nucleotidyltransferase [Alphaproteobacteria bacterium]